MANISFDPSVTSAPQNSFQRTTTGYVQGAFMDDPSSRMYLSSGVIASSVTQPFWGGMAIQELVPTANENQQGSSIALAADTAAVTGFSVFNQAYNWILTPGNTVPVGGAGMTAMFFRLGSNARIAVQADANLAAAIEGNGINQQVEWDFTNQKLIPYSANALPVKVLSIESNSKIVSYNSGTGAVTWSVGPAAVIQL
jgi:hypothetical protein